MHRYLHIFRRFLVRLETFKTFKCSCVHVRAYTCTQEPQLTNILTSNTTLSFRRMVKESSLSKSISLAKIYHSSLLSLIHLLIPLFLCHFIQMFPELVLVHGSLMSCWGLWQSATSFYPFTSCFVARVVLCPLSQSVYGMHVSVFALFMCLCVES